ncbi:MAG TPA: RPB7/RPC8 family DNA-directed RNA polymerase subunit, partial [Methanomicrobiales archaeon]|nr:RPB7/RPC8 family DNA-directed RNA polymerase subunit [Methanomicrobiales archaeon]
MYFRMKLMDKVRVPPNRLGEPLRAVVLNVLQQQLEGA